jgi:hypothetical protein
MREAGFIPAGAQTDSGGGSASKAEPSEATNKRRAPGFARAQANAQREEFSEGDSKVSPSAKTVPSLRLRAEK